MLENMENLNFAQRYQKILQEITEAAHQAGRDPQEIRILPVSKNHPVSSIQEAIDAGIRFFGENRVQEAKKKAELLGPDIRWSIIGPLQSNKAKYIARFAHEFQALDNIETAKILDERLHKEGRTLSVMLQINSSDEPQKSGIHPRQAKEYIQELQGLNNLHLTGLMTIAINSADEKLVADCFARTRSLRDSLLPFLAPGQKLDQLSMGMSNDYKIAIAQGSTCIRVGTALFGARSYDV